MFNFFLQAMRLEMIVTMSMFLPRTQKICTHFSRTLQRMRTESDLTKHPSCRIRTTLRNLPRLLTLRIITVSLYILTHSVQTYNFCPKFITATLLWNSCDSTNWVWMVCLQIFLLTLHSHGRYMNESHGEIMINRLLIILTNLNKFPLTHFNIFLLTGFVVFPFRRTFLQFVQNLLPQ